MKDCFDELDILELGSELRENEYFRKVAERQREAGRFKEILDRESKEPYLHRYSMMNLRPFARLCLHQILRSDNDSALHDHPWGFSNYILTGGYWEHTQEGRFWRGPGYNATQSAEYFHRLELDPDKAGGETWTLFLMGPKEKEWGFLKGRVWVPWHEYLGIFLDNLTE